jgi:hypothetical protein
VNGTGKERSSKRRKTVNKTTLLGTAIALALAASPLSAADRMRAGQWEFTTTQAGKGDATTFKHCITAAEAGSVNGDTKSARAYAERAARGECKVTEYKVEGNTVSYAILCGAVSIRSTTTYHGDTSEGDLFSKRDGSPQTVSHVRAKRLGYCP